MCTDVSVCSPVCRYMGVCVWTCACMCRCECAFTHVHGSVCMGLCMCACLCTTCLCVHLFVYSTCVHGCVHAMFSHVCMLCPPRACMRTCGFPLLGKNRLHQVCFCGALGSHRLVGPGAQTAPHTSALAALRGLLNAQGFPGALVMPRTPSLRKQASAKRPWATLDPPGSGKAHAFLASSLT